MFVDFETIRDSLDIDSYGIDEKIFLIGTWYKGVYRSFTIENTSESEEKRIILEFYKYLEDSNFPVCWYWYAEVSMLERSLKRNNIPVIPNILWRDLFKIFKDENFVVKGCKNFKLKSLIKSLSNLGKINVEKQPDECSSGMEAMIMAWKHYNIEKNEKDMETIIKYNKLDCEYLNILLDFIRNILI
jgi:predicted RecB family nuclease